MATTLAPVDAREVIRCDRCHLVRFRSHDRRRRHCHTSLDPEEPVDAAEPEVHPQNHTNGNGHNGSHLQVAYAIRSLRHRFGLSQRQLALRMQVPRTYVSKIENEKATPTLSSLERLARALEVSVGDLVAGGGHGSHQTEIRELMQDEFIAELIPYVSKLNGMQCSSILAQLHDMTMRPRRTS